jgi:hypothetical protein
MVEHSGQHVGEQAQLPDLAHRQRERDADRFLGPAERDQPLDGAPLVDRIQALDYASSVLLAG